MENLNGQQFLQKLLHLSQMTQVQMSEQLNISQGSLSNAIKKGNPNFTMIKDIAATMFMFSDVEIVILGAERLSPSFDWSYNNIIGEFETVQTLEDIAEKMKTKQTTLRSRISRNSCTLYQLKAHLEALGKELIFLINNKSIKII